MEFLRELIGMYREDFQSKFPVLETAVAAVDHQAVREIGHYLKGSSANLSMESLREAAFDMETAGQDQDAEKAVRALETLRREFLRLEEFLAGMPD